MSPAPLPLRAGHITIAELIDLYMAHYEGRDLTRASRLVWWTARLGTVTLAQLNDDQVAVALDELARQRPRFFAGTDADGEPIHKAKARQLSPATVNRYAAALAACITWAIKRRVAPVGYVHPCRAIERRPENNERTRYLSEDERVRLLAACNASKWPRLYLLVLMALTTGARKSELMGLAWGDIDLGRAEARVGRTKNGDPRVLTLVPQVVAELRPLVGAPGSLVFASARRPGLPYQFEQRWQEALKAAHIRGFTFHGLRHSCASMLAQNGATLLELAAVLGHRQLQMTKRYAHLATSHKAAVVNRVMGDVR
jgi:integrase